MTELILPHNWLPRPYQLPIFKHMFGDLNNPSWPYRKRAAEVWHRRAGKDSTAANVVAVASQMRVGTYWHMLPTLNQGRKVVWERIDSNGTLMIDQAFPEAMRSGINHTDMQIRFLNGSVYQVVGSDNFDSLIGANPIGVIFSEWSVADPRAWDFIRPILAENEGFALFIYTSRGKNHGYKTFTLAKDNPLWLAELLTVNDTSRHNGQRVITEEAIQEERRSGMDEEMIQQEYYCSFDTGMVGAFYANEMTRMKADGRIGDFPWMPDTQTCSVWDLGMGEGNDNFIIFAQPDGDYCRIIDCISGTGRGMPAWIKDVKTQPYVYSRHWAPHDIGHHDYSTGLERIETARRLGIDFDEVPNLPRADGIDATRVFLSRCKINESSCGPLLAALENYRREYDPRLKVYRKHPLHDWASNGADAMRYLSLSWDLNQWNRTLFSESGQQFKVIKSMTKPVRSSDGLQGLLAQRKITKSLQSRRR